MRPAASQTLGSRRAQDRGRTRNPRCCKRPGSRPMLCDARRRTGFSLSHVGRASACHCGRSRRLKPTPLAKRVYMRILLLIWTRTLRRQCGLRSWATSQPFAQSPRETLSVSGSGFASFTDRADGENLQGMPSCDFAMAPITSLNYTGMKPTGLVNVRSKSNVW